MTTTTTRTRWFTPAVCLALGGAIFAATAIGGDPAAGALSFGVMALIGLALTVAGPRHDERWAVLDLRASAASGGALGLGCLGAFLWETAHGRGGEPYVALMALGGLAYLVAVAVLRRVS